MIVNKGVCSNSVIPASIRNVIIPLRSYDRPNSRSELVVVGACPSGFAVAQSVLEELDQSTEDVEFEFEFDAVREGFPAGLVFVEACELEDENGDVE